MVDKLHLLNQEINLLIYDTKILLTLQKSMN